MNYEEKKIVASFKKDEEAFVNNSIQNFTYLELEKVLEKLKHLTISVIT